MTLETFGRLGRSGATPMLEFRRRLAHRPEKVWRALTDPEHLAAWFPTTIDGDRADGARLSFSFPPPHEQITPMSGELERFEPPRLLQFTWGPDRLRFELSAQEPGTLLTLTVELNELGKAARDGAGWHTCLDALELELAGNPDREVLSRRWGDVHPEYVARFGPEAATLGPPG